MSWNNDRALDFEETDTYLRALIERLAPSSYLNANRRSDRSNDRYVASAIQILIDIVSRCLDIAPAGRPMTRFMGDPAAECF
jgi:hypothetical protein